MVHTGERGLGTVALVGSVNFDRAADCYAATRALPADSMRERQTYSWTWQYPEDQMRAVADDLRDWAEREKVPLHAEHSVESNLRWWVFELPR